MSTPKSHTKKQTIHSNFSVFSYWVALFILGKFKRKFVPTIYNLI